MIQATAQYASKTPTTRRQARAQHFREKLAHDAVWRSSAALRAWQSLVWRVRDPELAAKFAMFAHAISKRKPTRRASMRKPERWSPTRRRRERWRRKPAVLVIDWVLLFAATGPIR